MPGKLKVKIVAGRHLPVMDRASDLTDAFVEVSEAHCFFIFIYYNETIYICNNVYLYMLHVVS